MMPKRPSSRAKILQAASELVRETSIASFSLDAVAARAGLSKGGLLYNFPTKTELLRALVEEHLAGFENQLAAGVAHRAGRPNALAAAYLSVARDEDEARAEPPSGLLAALAEDPGFLEPVRRFNGEKLKRMLDDAADPDTVLVAFLALEGLRLTRLLDLDVLDKRQRAAAYDRLEKVLGAGAAGVR